MIKSLEIINFESHAHTVLEDLSAGFNLVRGPSNFGKSSITRALRLVCFNEFNPESVRLGKKFCEVILTTDKGTIRVQRGEKINKWELTTHGGKTRLFEKIGTELIPEIVEITGMQPVLLGNVSFNANIMDQLEGHFMIDELDGKSASGSMRAQIIDEISGLSGIEGLIREVSLDNLRNGKEITRLEGESKSLEEGMHDKEALAREEKILDKVDGLMARAEALNNDWKKMTDLLSRETTAKEAVDETRAKIEALREVVNALKKLKTVEDSIAVLGDMTSTMQAYERSENIRNGVSDALKEIPETKRAVASLAKAEGVVEATVGVQSLVDAAGRVSGAIERVRGDIAAMPDSGLVPPLEEISDNLRTINGMRELVGLYNHEQTTLSECEGEISDIERGCAEANAEIDDILSQVEICPFCLGPVSAKCEHEVAPPRKARVKKGVD